MDSNDAWCLDAEDRASLLAELDLIEPQLAVATREEQERLLDEAFERAGIDPDWTTWQAVAGRYLAAYRDGARE